jgi:hypothetical protein
LAELSVSRLICDRSRSTGLSTSRRKLITQPKEKGAGREGQEDEVGAEGKRIERVVKCLWPLEIIREKVERDEKRARKQSAAYWLQNLDHHNLPQEAMTLVLHSEVRSTRRRVRISFALWQNGIIANQTEGLLPP